MCSSVRTAVSFCWHYSKQTDLNSGAVVAPSDVTPAHTALTLQAVANLFPQPFGLDRHRLRLRAGASEKLKLSFLPFQLPALQQSEPAAPGKLPVLKGLTHSLLVLSDSECGDFAYGLCGEVMLPVPFLEHKATVGLDGSQVGCKLWDVNSSACNACCMAV